MSPPNEDRRSLRVLVTVVILLTASSSTLSDDTRTPMVPTALLLSKMCVASSNHRASSTMTSCSRGGWLSSRPRMAPTKSRQTTPVASGRFEYYYDIYNAVPILDIVNLSLSSLLWRPTQLYLRGKGEGVSQKWGTVIPVYSRHTLSKRAQNIIPVYSWHTLSKRAQNTKKLRRLALYAFILERSFREHPLKSETPVAKKLNFPCTHE